MKNRIRTALRPLYGFMRYFVAEPDFLKKLIAIKSKGKKIILIGSPIHGNVGDHLICEAEKEFFNREFSDYKYIDCTMPFSRYFLSFILKQIHKDDYLMISGGGWLGSEWKQHEDFVRKIISSNSAGNSVILPQTVFYRENDVYMKQGIDIYKNASNLLFCVRDKYSYDFLLGRGFVPRDCLYYMPDFALFYDYRIKQERSKTKHINVCIRDDIEASLNADLKDNLIKLIAKIDGHYGTISTNTRGRIIRPQNRKKAIEDKINEIKDCDLLITDRLHAMLMAALSGTPCIAFDNSTHKVAGVYKWIEYLPYVHLYEAGDDIEEIINHMLSLPTVDCVFMYTPLKEYFTELVTRIKSMEG